MAAIVPGAQTHHKIHLAGRNERPHSHMTKHPHLIIAASLLIFPCAHGQDGETETPGSLGDLFNKVKELKVPESVSGLPKQITDLKESYLETVKTVEALRSEVDILRNEVYDLKKANEELRAAVGVKLKDEGLQALLKPEEVSATDLVKDYKEDALIADGKYRDHYLKVVGTVAAFEPGSQTVVLELRAEGIDTRVRCELQTGADFYVDVVPAQGRLISRNDRRTLLSVGQPVSVVGTCRGFRLHVEMTNCTIEGIVEKKKD
jgi:regulator of replication initiation timing